MDKNFLREGLAVLVKKSYIRKNPGYNFEEDKIYYISSKSGSRANLTDKMSGGRIIGSVTATHLELSTRHGIALNIESEASILLERARTLQQRAERLKRFESDDEEIAFMINDCLTEKKFSPFETVQFLRENGVEIKFKKPIL
jgi:hypothetical protein